MPERGECEGLFLGEDAILAAKKMERNLRGRKGRGGWEGEEESLKQRKLLVFKGREVMNSLGLFVSRELSSMSRKHGAWGWGGERAAQAC